MLQARPHLLRAWRSKDSTRNASSEKPIADKACEARLVTGTSTTDDGDILKIGDRRRVAVDNFILSVYKERRIGEGQGIEVRQDRIDWVGKIMLCSYDKLSTNGSGKGSIHGTNLTSSREYKEKRGWLLRI